MKTPPTRTLVLMRHAKSSWADSGQRDFDRPLNARGEAAAPEMGRRLRARGIAFDLIISSGARRALQTAQKVGAELGYARADIDIRDELYATTPAVWLQTIATLPAAARGVIIVGHNPEITEVANRLCPRPIDHVPTAAQLLLRYDLADWADALRATPREWDFDYPKRALTG